MWKDPIVEEIRNARMQLEKEFDNEPGAYVKHVCEQQKKNKSKLVTHIPKKHAKKVA